MLSLRQSCLRSRGRLQWARYFSSSTKNTVGFIGLGQMGKRMAANLLRSGRSLVVYDVFPEAAADLQKQNSEIGGDTTVTVAATPKEVAAQSQTVITMLPSSPHVRECYTGENGVLQGVQEGALLVDSSTIDPATSKDVSAAAAKHAGVRMVDAPVSGGVGGAEAGTLTFMVGGQDDAFEASKDVLEHMGKNIVHCGEAGTGQVAKVCNNLILAISMIGVSEAMALGVKSGMDPKKLAGIINTSTGRCWSSDTYNPVPGVLPGVPSANEYAGGFGSDLMKKDLSLAMMAAESSDSQLPFGKAAHEMYEQLHANGNGGKDFGYVYQHLLNNEHRSK